MNTLSAKENSHVPASMRIAVTGGVGLLGHAIIQELLDHGHRPVCIDLRRPEPKAWEQPCPDRVVDLTDLGQTYGALREVDAVIHCAAIPWAGVYPAEVVFRTNNLSHFNVLQASATLGIRKVVTTSSIQTVVRLHTEHPASPLYFPVDEEHPCCPDTEYGLSKETGEAVNRMIHRQYGIQTASIRLPGVWRADQIRQRRATDGQRQVRNFWSYVDPRDAAQCFRLAVESNEIGCEIFNACADDTSATTPSSELINRYFQGTEVRRPLEGFATLFSNAKARRLLGFIPQHHYIRSS